MNNSSSIHATCDFWTNLFLDKQVCCWPAGNGAVLQDNVVRMQSQAVTCMELTQGTRIGENSPPKDDGGLELRPSARSLILFPLFWKIALVEILLLRPLSPCGPGLPAGVRSAGEKAGAIRDLGKGPKAAHFGSGLRVLRVEGEVHGGTAPVFFFSFASSSNPSHEAGHCLESPKSRSRAASKLGIPSPVTRFHGHVLIFFFSSQGNGRGAFFESDDRISSRLMHMYYLAKGTAGVVIK